MALDDPQDPKNIADRKVMSLLRVANPRGKLALSQGAACFAFAASAALVMSMWAVGIPVRKHPLRDQFIAPYDRVTGPQWRELLDRHDFIWLGNTTLLTASPGSNQLWTVDPTWPGTGQGETIGAGASGQAGCNSCAVGGGAGAYNVNAALTLTAGGSMTYQIGAGGNSVSSVASNPQVAGLLGGNTWVNSASFVTSGNVCSSEGGQPAAGGTNFYINGTFGRGGLASNGFPTSGGNDGGRGSTTTSLLFQGAGGGGGAGGPSAAGNQGVDVASSTSATNGGQGDGSSGGAGGANANQYGSGNTNATATGGSPGLEYTATVGGAQDGSGGGGGGAGVFSSLITTTAIGGNGGTSGGGGGAAGANGSTATCNSGAGARGLAVMSWTPAAATTALMGGILL